jgi:hypothetical protein
MERFEHYEVWILDAGKWTCKSIWRDLELGQAVAYAHAGPVRIVRAGYEGNVEIERAVVETLRDSETLVQHLRSIFSPEPIAATPYLNSYRQLLQQHPLALLVSLLAVLLA